jgi:hypothetical protein
LGNFFKRLEVYTTIPPIPVMIDLIIKIMVELLSVLALTTKQIRQGRFSECIDQIYVWLCSMCRREICEEVVGEAERQNTGCPGEIGSVDEGRRIVGCCADLGYRPPRIKRNKQDETFVVSPPPSLPGPSIL